MAGDKNKLTEKQRQILEYLKQEILQRGFPPSVRDDLRSGFPSFYILGYMHIIETLDRKGIYQTRWQ